MLQAECTSEIGPHKQTMLTGLSAMDANGDGQLEYGEMVAYFTSVGATLRDDEFALILSDMTDNASTAQVLKLVQ